MKLTEHNEKVLQQFSEMMIARIEQMKAENWEKGWLGTSKGGRPVNIEGNAYKGGNVFMLMLLSAMQGYEYPIFCTLNQANRMGAHINKGEKSMPVIFWDFNIHDKDGKKITIEQYHNLSQEERMACSKIPFLKSYSVFNIAQTNIEEVKPDKVAQLKSLFNSDKIANDESGMYSNENIDTLLKEQSWLCPILFDKPQEGAYYSPSQDMIVVPMKRQFKRHRKPELVYSDGQEFYSTLLHEMIHSTSTEDRLNRRNNGRFGSPEYAKEELVAELGAARISSELGFESSIINNSACYLDAWLNTLKKEPTFILTVMTDVEKSSRMILDKLAA